MSVPEISVVITNYNHGQYIKRAVESTLNQTYNNFELILVDDGSKDNSKQIIEDEIIKLDDRIQNPIYLESNKGKWFALNKAISTAKGKLITILDADDCSHSHRLERQLQVLNDMKSFCVVTGFKHCYNDIDFELGKQFDTSQLIGYNIIDHKETLKKAYFGFKTEGINHFYAGHDYEIHANSALYLKQLWDHGIKYNPNSCGLMLTPGDDSDFLLRMTLLLQKTSILKEELYLYSRHTSTNPSFTLPK